MEFLPACEFKADFYMNRFESATYVLNGRGNLEWWRKVAFAGKREGKWVDNELVHTVNGEIFPVNCTLTKATEAVPD